jgi:hypothetical protein
VGPDNAGLYQLFIRSYCALLLDSPVDIEKPDFVIRRFFRFLLRRPPKQVILEFASLADAILASCVRTSDSTITGEFIVEMQHTPIFKEYLTFYQTGDDELLTYILTFLYFGKKMDYIDDTFHQVAFRDWQAVELELENLVIPPPVTSALRIIIRQLLGAFDDTMFLPKHGPGYTSEGFIDPSDKLDNLTLDAKSSYVFRSTSFGRFEVDRQRLNDFSDRVREWQIARIKFVPKNIKTSRSICMETILRMYLQQEVARWLICSMRDGLARHFIDFRDQEPNRTYAVGGSITGSCDTIDLQAASDRVHVDLVRSVMPPKVLYYLLGTRTDLVRTTEGVVRIRKFAPMGSALCFPVQSLIFCAITLLGYLEFTYGEDASGLLENQETYLYNIDRFIRSMHTDTLEVDPHRLLAPRIFGDDIICDSKATRHVEHLLTQCGLRVNSAKSFYGGQCIRESCGIYAYLGEDVTPILFRVPNFRSRAPLGPKVYASLIESANHFGDKGYVAVRSTLINYLKTCSIVLWRGKRRVVVPIKDYVPFVNDRNKFGIYTNHVCPVKSRWNADLQRDEYCVAQITPVAGRKPTSLMEHYAYDQWMRARIYSGSTESIYSVARTRPSTVKINLGWTPSW